MSAPAEVEAALGEIGRHADEEIDLAPTALLLAAIDRPRVALDRYRDHLDCLVRDVGATGAGSGTLAARAEALAGVLYERHGYAGDRHTYDDLQNANLMRVIDRRKGLPVALGILLLHAARGQGWVMHGLNFPGHFLLRLELGNERLVLDPFDRGRSLGIAELRQLLKRMAGDDAELLPEHYRPVGNREILLRLQNNIKTRALQSSDNDRAARVLQSMLLLAPGQAPIWREFGLLESYRGNLQSAISAFERYRREADNEATRRDAALLLQHVRGRLN